MPTTTPNFTPFHPLEGQIQQAIIVERVRGGQPRPYADHEDVCRVHFISHNEHRNTPYAQEHGYGPATEPDDPERYRYTPAQALEASDGNPEKADELLGNQERAANEMAIQQIRQALAVLGWSRLEGVGVAKPFTDRDDWIEYAKHVGPGVVEVMKKTLFYD